MNIVLTICSANYLAHAKTLGDSVLDQNPDFKFVIGLVDRFPSDLDPEYCSRFEVIPVEELKLAEFPDMAAKYNIVELNTAVKPFYMAHLYERDRSVATVTYLDPDMMVYSSFGGLLKTLEQNNIVLTPHSCTYDDSPENIHYEQVMLYAGVYNLGFIATRRTAPTLAFLQWWKIRLKDHCFYRTGVAGAFFDQLWTGLVPVYFDGVYVEKDPGYNFCYWNHFERRLENHGGKYLVNGSHDLVFVHYSGYKPERPEVTVTRPEEPIESFENRPDLRPIYDEYRRRLLERGYPEVKKIRWHFAPPERRDPFRGIKKVLKASVDSVIRTLPLSAKTRLKRFALFAVQSLDQ
jgi:hypothetical protein